MKTKTIAALTACSILFAGCASSGSSSTTSSNTSSSSSSEPAAPELLAALVDNSDDDAKALEAWQALLSNTASMYDYSFYASSDGEDYLYTEKGDDSMVKENFIYEIGRDAVYRSANGADIAVDLTDVEDSYEALITGYGTIDRFVQDPVLSSVKLSDTQNDTLKGTVESVSTQSDTSQSDAAVTLLMDALINYGYVRTVDPFHNASLYDFSLEQKGDEWSLNLKIKDLDAFRKKANESTTLYDDRNNRPVLVMNEIESETFTFVFDQIGVLEKLDNQTLHVISAIKENDNDTYMNLDNKTEIGKASDEDMIPSAFDTYFGSLADGSLKDGDSFEIQSWKD